VKSSERDYSLFTDWLRAHCGKGGGSTGGFVHYWRNSGNEKKIALQTDYMKLKPLPGPR